jgi:hypothetical protein
MPGIAHTAILPYSDSLSMYISIEERAPPVSWFKNMVKTEVVQRVPAGRAEWYSPRVVIAPYEESRTGHKRISLLSVHVPAADSRSGADIWYLCHTLPCGFIKFRTRLSQTVHMSTKAMKMISGHSSNIEGAASDTWAVDTLTI